MRALLAPLTEYLHEPDPPEARAANLTTVLAQGQRAESWLLEVYLSRWLDRVGALATVPSARALASPRLRWLAREAAQLGAERDKSEWIFYLGGVERILRTLCAEVARPDERAMQWAIWARDVPMALSEGFLATELLDPVLCEAAAPCCLYAAFLVSMVIEDPEQADAINLEMFEELPRQLLQLLQAIPVAPEA